MQPNFGSSFIQLRKNEYGQIKDVLSLHSKSIETNTYEIQPITKEDSAIIEEKNTQLNRSKAESSLSNSANKNTMVESNINHKSLRINIEGPLNFAFPDQGFSVNIPNLKITFDDEVSLIPPTDILTAIFDWVKSMHALHVGT